MTDRFAERTSTRPDLEHEQPARQGTGPSVTVGEAGPNAGPNANPKAGPKPARKPGQRPGGATAAGAKPTARRARLRLTRVDPWSVMKTAFLLSIAFGIVTVVSVLMVWSVLGAAGVWEAINQTVRDTLGGEEAATFNVEDYVGTSRVIGFTMLVAVIDVVLLTAAATLGAFLYNMASALLGGIEMTLAEDS